MGKKIIIKKGNKKMAIRKKGTHVQPMNTKKQLNKKTINKKVDKKDKLFIIEQINKLLQELE